VARDLCINCLLHGALVVEVAETDSLDAVLAEIDVRDAEWRLGNYQILEEIGRGGMGVIYRARQKHSRRIVAVKRVLSYHSDSQETLARFQREAEAAASLDHPNILPIYEVGLSEGLPYFSMKFATGGSLLEQKPALRAQPRRCVALVAKVARAVQYAHMQGILHRDLKPGNILLDARGEPLVSDFGLAKWLDTTRDLTRTLTIFGTPGYIAPEQARGQREELKPSADVYSLGAILFDLFTGRPPFLGEHALAVIRQAEEKAAPKLRSLRPELDRDLETICSKCLEREPAARYRSAGELAEDLERWLEGRPIVARPVWLPVRGWRWSRRNPKLAASLAACFALGTVAGIWLIERRHLEKTVLQDRLAARSVIVLPFLNLDTTQPDEEIVAKVSQELQSNLSRLGPVRIVPVSHSRSVWAGTGNIGDIVDANEDAKARAVLTGTERAVAGKLHVSVRLMNAATGEILTTQFLDIAPGETAGEALVKAIGPLVDRILNARDWSSIAPNARDPGMRNPNAREFIISGRQLMFRDTIEDYDRSSRCLERALQIEPDSALAHAYLSSTQVSHAHFFGDITALQQGELHAKTALRLEPQLPDGHRALAGVFYQKNELVEALEEDMRVVEMSGPDERISAFIGLTLIGLGQPHRALGWLEMAGHWAALPGNWDGMIGDCWTLLEDDQRAEAAYQRTIDLRPESPDGWVGLCHLRLLQGDITRARKIWQENDARLKGYEIVKNDNHPLEMLAQIEFFARNYPEAERLYSKLALSPSAGGTTSYGGLSYASALARLRQAQGDTNGAQASLKACLANETSLPSARKNLASLYRIAAIESMLGDTRNALQHLQAAVDAGWIDYRSLRLDPRFDAIAGDPVFHQIISALTTKVAELRRQTGQPITTASTGEKQSP
jgi:serine/threonine protein kinase/tetratricopeptide (TPR) repeat protein